MDMRDAMDLVMVTKSDIRMEVAKRGQQILRLIDGLREWLSENGKDDDAVTIIMALASLLGEMVSTATTKCIEKTASKIKCGATMALITEMINEALTDTLIATVLVRDDEEVGDGGGTRI